MLYPKEDKSQNTLMFACRTCTFSEPATSSCVFRNELSNTVGETAGITQDVGSDPTVGCFHLCIMCGQEILCEICENAEAEGLVFEVEDQDMVDGDALFTDSKRTHKAKITRKDLSLSSDSDGDDMQHATPAEVLSL